MDRAVDLDTLLEQLGGDRALLEHIAELFLADYRGALARMRAALGARDRDALHSVAHSLKGSAASFHAHAAVAAAQAIERCCRAGDLEQAQAPVAELEAAVEVLAQALRSHLESSRKA